MNFREFKDIIIGFNTKFMHYYKFNIYSDFNVRYVKFSDIVSNDEVSNLSKSELSKLFIDRFEKITRDSIELIRNDDDENNIYYKFNESIIREYINGMKKAINDNYYNIFESNE